MLDNMACHILLATLLTSSCAAQPGNPLDKLPPGTLLPAARIRLSVSESAYIPAVSHDGETAWAVVCSPTTNVWPWLVHRWVFFGSGILALIFTVVGLRAWRILARPQEVGKQYCLRCGYCLFGVAYETCPECGRRLSHPSSTEKGRTRKRRLFPLIAAAGLAGVIFGTAVMSLPRHGPICSWFDWPSIWLAAWEGPRPNRTSARAEHARGRTWLILEIDLGSGTIGRSLFASAKELGTVEFSSDANALFVQTERTKDSPTIRIDLSTGAATEITITAHRPAVGPESRGDLLRFSGVPDGFHVTSGRRIGNPTGLAFGEAVTENPHVHLHLVGDELKQRWINVLSYPPDVVPCWVSLHAISADRRTVIGGNGKELFVWTLESEP